MRQTSLFKAVRSIFQKEHQPLSVPEVRKKLKQKNISPNKTSLYRLLEKMKQEDLIEETLLDSRVAFYEWKSGNHHHHFVCSQCKQIHCFSDSTLEEAMHNLEYQLQKKGHKVANHQFSLSGICNHCIS